MHLFGTPPAAYRVLLPGKGRGRPLTSGNATVGGASQVECVVRSEDVLEVSDVVLPRDAGLHESLCLDGGPWHGGRVLGCAVGIHLRPGELVVKLLHMPHNEYIPQTC